MEKIRIEELITKYEFEPSLKDIFTEGDSDVCIMNFLLEKMEDKETKVFSIDSIDISKDYLIENGLQENNRGRVIALSMLLQDSSSYENNSFLIIDRDFDYLNSINIESNILKYTDFSCMEMYSFDNRVVDEFLKLHYSDFKLNGQAFLFNISEILQDLFLIRMANANLHWNLESYDFLKECKLNTDLEISFNREVYINKYLNKNSRISDKTKFLEEVDSYRSLFNSNIRYQINGHDFIRLFIWYIEKIRNRKCPYDESTLWKMLFSHCFNFINEHNLFKKVKSFIS